MAKRGRKPKKQPPAKEADGEGIEAMPTARKVIDQPIVDEMERSYIDYAMSVIIGRALPDVRDGLKPVHRRILYAMSDLGLTHDKAYKKSARIVGEVLGKYHPHGDMAVYDSLVRMAQTFSLRYPLIDGQGNYGSVDGDRAAAMRYTEARTAIITKELLQDIEKNTVEWTKNFDESLDEPVVLPAKIPNLLLNGSSGIAVGMATNIPPHNINETVDAIIMVIDNPEVTLSDIMTVLPGPDFPTGGIIYGQGGITEAYATGRGPVTVRARTHIEDRKGGGYRVVATEIPYMVNKSTLLENIAKLVRNKVIDGIVDLRDESDRSGMRIVIELSREKIDSVSMAEVTLNQLFKHTAFQTTFGINNLAIVDGEPKVLTLKETINHYIEFRKEVITRSTKWKLKKAQEREHILQGLIIAQNNLDEVIKIIRRSKDAPEAKERLMKKFKLSDVQAKAILEMRLQKLTGIEVQALKKEEKEVQALIKRLEKILSDIQEVLVIIKKDLLELKEKYGDERRTQIEEHTLDLNIEHLVPNEKVVVQMTNEGYVKRIPVTTFKAQRRGGVGLIGTKTKDEDFVTDLFTTMCHDYIMFFTNLGRAYWLKAYNIPEKGRYARGIPIIQKLSGLKPGEMVQAMIPVPEFSEKLFVTFVTKRGVIKKTPLMAYSHIRKTGVQAIKLREGDEVVSTKLTDGQKEVIIATKNGKAIRFSESKVRSMGRVSHGVRGVRLRGNDLVVAMAVAEPKEVLLTITKNGYGKRTQVKAYRKTNRGGVGVANMRITEKNGKVIQCLVVSNDDELIVTSKRGMIIRMAVKDIPIKKGRAVMGVRVMRLRIGDEVMAVAKMVSEKKVEEVGEEAKPPQKEPPVKRKRGRPRKK